MTTTGWLAHRPFPTHGSLGTRKPSDSKITAIAHGPTTAASPLTWSRKKVALVARFAKSTDENSVVPYPSGSQDSGPETPVLTGSLSGMTSPTRSQALSHPGVSSSAFPFKLLRGNERRGIQILQHTPVWGGNIEHFKTLLLLLLFLPDSFPLTPLFPFLCSLFLLSLNCSLCPLYLFASVSKVTLCSLDKTWAPGLN